MRTCVTNEYIKKPVTVYFAFDNKKFETEAECIAYEEKFAALNDKMLAFEILDMEGDMPLIRDYFEEEKDTYRWFEFKNKEQFDIVNEYYYHSLYEPDTYPAIGCVMADYENDYKYGYRRIYYLSEMIADAMKFYKRFGYDAKITKE
jgi:hypothetical protein